MVQPRLSASTVIVLLALGGSACSGPLDCTLVETSVLEVRPVDAVTEAPVADSAAGTFTVDGMTEALGPLRFDGAGRLLTLGGGRGPGTYQVRVEHPRFAPWNARIVVLAGEACQYAIPVTLVARLVHR